MYLNLTDGLEFLHPFVKRCEEENKPVPFKVVRLPSTWLEQHQWDKFIGNVDADLLLHLALGDTCIIFDCGSRGKLLEDGTCPSRAQWMGIPLISYILNRLWFDRNPVKVDVREANVRQLFNEIYTKAISETTFTKLRYFKKYIPEDLDQVNLLSRSMKSTHDSDYGWYADIAQTCL